MNKCYVEQGVFFSDFLQRREQPRLPCLFQKDLVSSFVFKIGGSQLGFFQMVVPTLL